MAAINRLAYLDKDHSFAVREEPIPQPGNQELCVKIMANGICGSDIHFFRDGRLGNFVVTDPYVPGHEASGRVFSLGAGVNRYAVGDSVVVEPGIPCGRCRVCRSGRYNLCGSVRFLSAPPENGTFCDYLVIRADSVHPMPVGVTYEQGAMAEPAAVAVHAVNRGRVQNGDTGVIVGCGPIGLMVLQAFLAAGGSRAFCIDSATRRLALAARLGAHETLTPGDLSGTDSCKGDVVFETAGSSQATEGLFALARPGGRVVQVGWPETNRVNLDIAGFIEKELEYVAVNRYANAFQTALSWIGNGRIRTEELVSTRYVLQDIGDAFKHAFEHRDEVVKVMVLNE